MKFLLMLARLSMLFFVLTIHFINFSLNFWFQAKIFLSSKFSDLNIVTWKHFMSFLFWERLGIKYNLNLPGNLASSGQSKCNITLYEKKVLTVMINYSTKINKMNRIIDLTPNNWTQKRPRHKLMKIHVLAWDRQKQLITGTYTK